MGGYGDHPHSWPPPPSHTRLLSCLQLRVLSVPSHTLQSFVDGRVILATHRLPEETQVLTAGICVAQWEKKLGLYRCLRLDHPKPAVLASLEQYVPSVLGHSSHSQSPGAAPSGGWQVLPKGTVSGALGALCHTGQDGDPSLPTSDLVLTKGWPNRRGHTCFFVSTLVHWECQPPSSTHGIQACPVVAASGCCDPCILHSPDFKLQPI